MKRILSILLVLAMLLSMIPAVFAANCDITVSTPAPDPVKVGALYQLPLRTVFTDPNGHALSFALKADYGDKVYIKDNTLQFTSAEAGEFRIGITATCTDGGSAETVVPITVEAVEDGDKNQYGYDETDQASVTVYVTISSDGAPIIGKDDGGTILSHLEVKVPYFPLSLYGLDDFNRYHTENGSGSYTDNEIVQRPTLLHLYIYMLERYYLGVAEKDCGKGTSGLLEFTGSGEGVNDMLGGSYEDTRNALLISGSATSMYMQNFWGHGENLMYYRNHVYPLMSAGWGSTADYILLSDNDTIDLAMFSNWSFWTYGAFARFDKDDYTAKVGEKITFETQKYDTKSVSDGGTESFEPITGLNVKLYNENWEQQQELTSEGSSYTLDTASLKAGTYYLLGYDPNYGTEDACYAPATAKVVLTSEAPQPCQWDEGVVTTEPTCTTAGVKTFSCSVHGETRTEELPALGHEYGSDGLCTRCGAQDPAIPTQDESGVYCIASEKQLQWFAAKVNGGDTAISGKLTANIELTEAWTPMGSQKQPFTGSFDGDGHSITGMSITFDSNDKSVGAPYLGLFGYVKGTADKKAEIKNLMLSGKLDITENYRNSYAYSGGLVGGAEYVSFTDVTVDVAVTAKQGTAPYPWSYIGGFAGTVTNADFLRCVNNGSVTSDGDYVSGFVPKSEKTTYTACANNGAITGRTKVGGIGADVKSTRATDCGNTGAISLVEYGTGNQEIGGLFARICYGSALTRCYNTGAVTGDAYVGGLVGTLSSYSDSTNGVSYIVDSYNSGAITGHSDKNYCGIGGLVGNLEGGMRSYSQSYIHNCYNAGAVTDLGLKTAGNPGAAIGFMHSDYSEASYHQVEDVYYLACGLEGVGKMGYSTLKDPTVLKEMSEEDMKSADFIAALGESFKADGTCMQKVNSGYPILVWQKLAEGQSEHTLEKTTVVDPTCTEQGYTIYTCTACGETLKADFVPANGHSYEASVVAPTCEKDGYTNHVCSVCGDSYVGSYTDALEHTYTAVVTKEPTCTEEGVKTFTCSECGKSYTEAIPTVAHRYEAVVTAPTCDKMGYTTYTCSACGDSYVADYVDAVGHDCETETVPATCLGYGFVRESCKHCDYSVITEITAPLGHDYQAVVTAPTLDEGGYTTHTCSRCGDSYVDSETPALGHKCAAYTDIPTDWAKEGICFVIENGLMVGTTSTTFAPKDTLTRAMLVTVLYRMAGSPAVDAPSGFTDVADGQWYSDAIAWAAANGIVNGVGGNKFAPSEPVTREQLAAIFFRYAKAEAPEADVLSGYPDTESVSTYARDAMAWAVSTGLVTGSKEADGTYLVPQGLAAREQAAAILMRYVKANA